MICCSRNRAACRDSARRGGGPAPARDHGRACLPVARRELPRDDERLAHARHRRLHTPRELGCAAQPLASPRPPDGGLLAAHHRLTSSRPVAGAPNQLGHTLGPPPLGTVHQESCVTHNTLRLALGPGCSPRTRTGPRGPQLLTRARAGAVRWSRPLPHDAPAALRRVSRAAAAQRRARHTARLAAWPGRLAATSPPSRPSHRLSPPALPVSSPAPREQRSPSQPSIPGSAFSLGQMLYFYPLGTGVSKAAAGIQLGTSGWSHPTNYFSCCMRARLASRPSPAPWPATTPP